MVLSAGAVMISTRCWRSGWRRSFLCTSSMLLLAPPGEVSFIRPETLKVLSVLASVGTLWPKAQVSRATVLVNLLDCVSSGPGSVELSQSLVRRCLRRTNLLSKLKLKWKSLWDWRLWRLRLLQYLFWILFLLWYFSLFSVWTEALIWPIST